jgi:WD40 repeat protein
MKLHFAVKSSRLFICILAVSSSLTRTESAADQPNDRALLTFDSMLDDEPGQDETVRRLDNEKSSTLQPRMIRRFDPVRAFAFDHEGRKLVMAGNRELDAVKKGDAEKSGVWPGKIAIWDAVNGAELSQIGGDFGVPLDVTFSPNGKTILAGGFALESPDGGELNVWGVDSGKSVHSLEGHAHRVLAVAWSPDGTLMASGSADQTVRVWDASSGKETAALKHPSTPAFLTFSRDGKTLVVGCRGGTVKLWIVERWQERGTLEDITCSISGIDISPDGKFLAVVGIPFEVDGKSTKFDTPGLMRLWHVPSGLRRATWRIHSWPTGVAFSPDGKYVAHAAFVSSIWEVATQEEVAVIRRNESATGEKIRFSPDGKSLAIGGTLGVELWDVKALGRPKEVGK